MITVTKSLSREEYLRKKRKKRLWKFGIAIFLVFSLIGIVSYASHRHEVRISKVELNGGILVTQHDIEEKTLTHLYGSYFWLFPKGNSFLYSKKELSTYLKETFRRIDTINIHLKGLNTLVIDIKERKPFAIWCDKPLKQKSFATTTGETLADLKETNEVCYFMDQNSTIFAKAPTFSGDAYFKYYGILSLGEGELPIGKEYMASTTKFFEISDFVAKAKELSISPQSVVAKDDGQFSLFVSGGGEIYFDLKGPLIDVGDNLRTLLRTPTFASTSGNLPVEYIDLRYGNKLFYKLK